MDQQIDFKGPKTTPALHGGVEANPEYVQWLEQKVYTLQKAVFMLQSEISQRQKTPYDVDALPYWEDDE